MDDIWLGRTIMKGSVVTRYRSSSLSGLHHSHAGNWFMTSWKYRRVLWENHPLRVWKIGWFCHADNVELLRYACRFGVKRSRNSSDNQNTSAWKDADMIIIATQRWVNHCFQTWRGWFSDNTSLDDRCQRQDNRAFHTGSALGQAQSWAWAEPELSLQCTLPNVWF